MTDNAKPIRLSEKLRDMDEVDLANYLSKSTKTAPIPSALFTGRPKGNFKLKKKIESLDEFWQEISTSPSVFARHRVYPSAFLQNWTIRTISSWLQHGWFWTIEPKDEEKLA